MSSTADNTTVELLVVLRMEFTVYNQKPHFCPCSTLFNRYFKSANGINVVWYTPVPWRLFLLPSVLPTSSGLLHSVAFVSFYQCLRCLSGRASHGLVHAVIPFNVTHYIKHLDIPAHMGVTMDALIRVARCRQDGVLCAKSRSHRRTRPKATYDMPDVQSFHVDNTYVRKCMCFQCTKTIVTKFEYNTIVSHIYVKLNAHICGICVSVVCDTHTQLPPE
ncbi:hypothetical protein SARC_11442 [Sphaeroforma arctica JP610]|uniref:Uncharacterized protein n=1 Tax=Sphaeroforma arctica JP610 TaxID=667725 RepID=A0A0L0FHV0_9EUKA|nr:hypothetical protein SARC_11442 [Sphaeroforma arctica JP610]KNC76046.1 hypothetical protein SARC_11442 [Sphaeroforma arctica JP610]|eukprot:XP_014149948.1 hypothetical protein SARC_11442 [Sphaeroforma arctica JP610]